MHLKKDVHDLLEAWEFLHDHQLPQHFQDRFLINEYAVKIVDGCNSRRWDWKCWKGGFMDRCQEIDSVEKAIRTNKKLADALACLELIARTKEEIKEVLIKEKEEEKRRAESEAAARAEEAARETYIQKIEKELEEIRGYKIKEPEPVLGVCISCGSAIIAPNKGCSCNRR